VVALLHVDASMIPMARPSNPTQPTEASDEPTIAHVMTLAPHTIGSDQPLHLARKIMQEHGLRHLPVLRSGTLIGLVSHRDLLLIERMGVDGNVGSVAETMTSEVYTARADEPVREVARAMYLHGYTCAVVVDGSRLLGIFTASDALKQIGELR
jgi:acetoin utilization protein AcuB